MKTRTLLNSFILLLILDNCLAFTYDDNDTSDESNCTQTLNNMISDLNNYQFSFNASNYTKNFAALSGRYINDFGEYDVCQNQTLNYYLTLNFTGNISGTSINAVIGFCAPMNCSISDIESNVDLVYQLYKAGMVLPLDQITTPNQTFFYDPKSSPPGDKASTIIIIIVLCGVFALSVVGTALGARREFLEAAKIKKNASEGSLRESGDPTDFGNGHSNKESKIIEKKELRGIYKFLDCFDIRKNFDKIVKIKYTETYDFNLEIFNGIRVFMMLYVVYGHSFLFGTDYIDNLIDIPQLANSTWLLIPYSALYAVDVFFYMSGFLFAYIGLGKLKKMKPNVKNYFGLAIHRLLRFWPTYVLAIIFFWRILPLLSEGPIWFQMTYYTNLCEGTVWQNLLLLDDILVQSADYCFGWGWYLSNDFQMFLLTPFFIWLYIKNKRTGKLAMVILMVISWGLALWIGAVLNVKGSPPKAGDVTNGQGFSEYYVKPYIRLPPYFIGVLAALLYREYKEKHGSSYEIGKAIKSSTLLKNLIPFIGFVSLLLLTFLPRYVQLDVNAWPDWFHVTWRAFQKSWYVIALTMVILPILLGEDTLLKKFLSHPLLVPLARLSFTAYLVHLFWVYQNYYNAKSSFHYSYPNVLFNTISNGVMAFSGGLVLSLLAEIPMGNLESTYISGARSQRPRKVKPDSDETSQLNGTVDNTSLPLSIAKVKESNDAKFNATSV